MRYEKNIDLKLIGKISKLTYQYKQRKVEAREYIRRAFLKSKKIYLALSGGKDSVAMLAIVNEVAWELNREFVCWVHVSDASFPETEEICIKSAKQVNRKLLIDRSPVSAWDVIGTQSKQKFGKKGYFFDAVNRMSNEYDLVFIGVRAAESKRRRDCCLYHGAVFSSGDILKCHPIQNFAIEDVAGLLCEYEMPIHPIYTKKPIGQLPIRLGYVTGLDLIEKNTMIFLKINYPKLYQRLIEKMPKLKNY